MDIVRGMVAAAGLLLLAWAAGPGSASAAAFIKTQPPCDPCDGVRYDDESVILRRFTYKVPGPGKALVSFHGSILCVGGQDVRRVVDLTSQIVIGTTSNALLNGPSGMRHAAYFDPSATNEAQAYEDFSLASQRVITHSKAGKLTVSLKTFRNRMDIGTFCNLTNGIFSVVFFPKQDHDGVIVSQKPCGTGGDACAYFDTDHRQIPPVRSISFNAPGKGTARIQVGGSLFCINEDSARGTIDVDTAIVGSASAAARPDLPGGMKHRIVLEPADGPNGSSDSFNLESTRVVEIDKSGKRTFHFRITPRQMGPGTYCYVYNPTFSVVFVRASGPYKLSAQSPCAGAKRWCDTFTENDPATQRLFKATAGRKGKAQVVFHGSSVCQSRSKEPYGVYLTTQIALDGQEFAQYYGPGGLNHPQRLERANGKKAVADTFNFASTRVMDFNKAGETALRFLITRNMFPKQKCFLYNAAFSSLFVPG